MATGSMAKIQRNSTFFAKYDVNNLPKIASVNPFRSYILTYSSTSP